MRVREPPPLDPRRLSVQRDPAGRVAFVRCLPNAGLAPHVHAYYGYREETGHAMRRREVPRSQVVLIIDFGPTLRFLDPVTGDLAALFHGGFVAGLYSSYVLTETSGSQSGLQVNFTPLGARHFFGQRLADLANRSVGLVDVFGPEGDLLAERLAEMPDWAARFAAVEALLAGRLADAASPPPRLVQGYRRLIATQGRIGIAALAAELDCSRKHLLTLFGAELGLGPKQIARMLRFNHAAALLESGATPDLAAAALAAGYYDQAHMNRDFRAFSGSPPGEFLRARLPNEGGLAGG